MVYLEPEGLGINPFIDCWVDKLPEVSLYYLSNIIYRYERISEIFSESFFHVLSIHPPKYAYFQFLWLEERRRKITNFELVSENRGIDVQSAAESVNIFGKYGN